MPEIHSDGDSVTFAFDLPDLTARLMVRCDAHGDVYACLRDIRPSGPAFPFTAGE